MGSFPARSTPQYIHSSCILVPRMQPVPQHSPIRALYKGRCLILVKIAIHFRALNYCQYIIKELHGRYLPEIHTSTTYPSNHTAKDHSIHIRGSTAYSTTNLKQSHTSNKDVLDLEQPITSTNEEDSGHRSHKKSNTNPSQLFNLSLRNTRTEAWTSLLSRCFRSGHSE